MYRAVFGFAATFAVTALLASSTPAGQTAQAPPMKSVLAGKKFVPPVKGIADVDYTTPVTRREKTNVITRIMVKNIAAAPIARLSIDQIWYGKDGAVVTRGRGVINGLLQPGEVQTITIDLPFDARMNSNNYNFSHANGTVKPNRVAKIETPPAAPAAAPK
jgi:hypothetical protein